MKHFYRDNDCRVPIPEVMRRPFLFDRSVLDWIGREVSERSRPRQPKRLDLFSEHRLDAGAVRGSFGT